MQLLQPKNTTKKNCIAFGIRGMGSTDGINRNAARALLFFLFSLGLLTACNYQLRGVNSPPLFPAQLHLLADDQNIQVSLIDQLNTLAVEVIDETYQENSSNTIKNIPKVTVRNTNKAKQALMFNENGYAIAWQFTLSTELLITHKSTMQLITLQEYEQVNIDSNINASNDKIEAITWDSLYSTLAQRIIDTIPKVLLLASDN